MNRDTRVAVCAYAGDAHQVITMLPIYLAHECPVVVLSPEDSPADVRYPGVDTAVGGKRAYIGQDCLDRMRVHLRLLLSYPENHFLIHDADSICLSPRLPDYLYELDVLWSNLITNGIPEQQPGFASDIPHIAFQPPWFMSRRIIQALLDVSEDCTVCNPYLPFIDFWMVEMAIKGSIPYRALPYAVSGPASSDPPTLETIRRGVKHDGIIFVHSIKGMEYALPLLEAYNERGY